MNSSGESAAREQWILDTVREIADKFAHDRDQGKVRSMLYPIIARHYAKRAREVQALVNALKAATRCPTCDGTGKMTVECISCCYGEAPNPAGGVCTCSEETCAQCDGKGWATADGTGEELVAAALAPFAAKGETGSVAAQGEQHDH